MLKKFTVKSKKIKEVGGKFHFIFSSFDFFEFAVIYIPSV
jgi:hypothetical protein